MPPIKSKYHTSCLYRLACPQLFKELVTPPQLTLHPTPNFLLTGVLYSYSFLRSASLNKILCITGIFKENTLLCHEKKCINQLDSYLFEKTIENLLIRQYVGILFHMGMRRCYRFSKYCTVWKKHQRKKKGREGGEKKKSHDLGNHLTLWIIYQETLKKENPLFLQ